MAQKNLKELIYDAILEGIYSSEFRPNEILTENALIKKYGYSKSPVREALTALCHEGVLQNIPRCGYQVVALTSDDIEQMMEYRRILETGMLRTHFSLFTAQHIKKLKEISILCNKTTDDVMEHWIYNADFHIALASVGRNEYLCAQLRTCMNTLWRAYAQLHWNKWSKYSIPADMKYHDQIIEAIQNQDLDHAILCLENDLGDFGIS